MHDDAIHANELINDAVLDLTCAADNLSAAAIMLEEMHRPMAASILNEYAEKIEELGKRYAHSLNVIREVSK